MVKNLPAKAEDIKDNDSIPGLADTLESRDSVLGEGILERVSFLLWVTSNLDF